MNVIDLLIEDHREVDELFRRFQIADKPETLDEIGKEIVQELSVHAAVEEQFLYPLARMQLDEGGEVADHSIEEHAEVKRLLSDLEKQDPASAEYSSTMEDVIGSVRHHVEEEESEMFPPLRERTAADTLEKVGGFVEQAKKAVPTHPHPLVPGNATSQLVAGPWAAVVDKARDLVGGGGPSA